MEDAEFIHLYLREGQKILEIGCGDGSFLNKLVKTYNFKRVVGVDLKEQEFTEFEYHKISAEEDLDLKDKFDIIITKHVLEHIRNPIGLLENLKKHLKKHGKIFIIVPNRNGFRNEAKIYFPEDGKHYWLFDEESLVFTLNRVGFTCRLHYNPDAFGNSILRKLFASIFRKRHPTILLIAMKDI